MYSRVIFIFHLLCYILSLNLQRTTAQEEGENCIAQGKSGICRLLSNCPSAVQARQQHNQNPVICSFPGTSTVPIVCCVETDINNKSYQKCMEYSEYVYEWMDIPTLTGSKFVKVDRCPQIDAHIIVDSTNALPGQFPHMTVLGFEDGTTIRWICGGTLISERFVLTAGHCTFSTYGEVKRVRLGDEFSKVQEFGIAEIIPHPKYKRSSRYNDIALLRINGTVVLNRLTIPACLRWDPLITETRAIITGLGRPSSGGEQNNVLKKVILDIFSQSDCNATYASLTSNSQLRSGIMQETQLCAGHKSDSREKDVCQGDSGGPLQVFQKNGIYCMYSIIGVTSFGSGCSNIGTPGVYTRVSAYVPWIESIVWP